MPRRAASTISGKRRRALRDEVGRKRIAGQLFGLSFETLLDAWMPSLAFDSDEERAKFRADRLAERAEPRGGFDVRTLDGRSLRVNVRRTIEGGIVQTFWDLTDDVHREQELRSARHVAEVSSAAVLKAVPSVLRSDATVTEFLQPIRRLLGGR